MDSENTLMAFEGEKSLVIVEYGGLEVPAMVGAMASVGAELEVSKVEHTAFEKSVADFLNPEFALTASEQLATMGEFWNKLGYTIPALSDEQTKNIQEAIEAHPGKRLVPTLLLDFKGRQNLVKKAKEAFTKNDFDENAEPLWTPDNTWVYGELLRSPNSVVEQNSQKYMLGYTSPSGDIVVGRSDYEATMVKAGRAIISPDGVWVFPVMDAQVQSPRTDKRAGELFKSIDPSITPESLIAMQLLHQVAGTPNSHWGVDIANEAVYEVNKDGEPKSLVGVASVDWVLGECRVALDRLYPRHRGSGIGVRDGVSAL